MSGIGEILYEASLEARKYFCPAETADEIFEVQTSQGWAFGVEKDSLVYTRRIFGAWVPDPSAEGAPRRMLPVQERERIFKEAKERDNRIKTERKRGLVDLPLKMGVEEKREVFPWLSLEELKRVTRVRHFITKAVKAKYPWSKVEKYLFEGYGPEQEMKEIYEETLRGTALPPEWWKERIKK